MINVDIKSPDMNKIKKSLGVLENNAPKVLVRAINRAAITARATIKKQSTGAPGIYRVKSSAVDKSTKIAKANTNTIKAVVTIKGGTRPLSQFIVSPKRVVSYKGKSRSPKRYKAAVMKKNSPIPLEQEKNKPFVAVTQNNFMGLFSRTENKVTRSIKVTRNTLSGIKVYTYERTDGKLQMHYGPAIPQMISNEKVFHNMESNSEKTLNNRLNHEIKLLLRRMG